MLDGRAQNHVIGILERRYRIKCTMMWDDERALPLLFSHDTCVSSVDTVDVSDYRGTLDRGLCKRDQFVGVCRYAFQITGSWGLEDVYRFEVYSTGLQCIDRNEMLQLREGGDIE